jgi:hypothetical protein
MIWPCAGVADFNSVRSEPPELPSRDVLSPPGRVRSTEVSPALSHGYSGKNLGTAAAEIVLPKPDVSPMNPPR